MITIDGSQGEGGGQILRTSLALSAITGSPVTIENIRARRPKPGLQRQHLLAAQAAARVCHGELIGAELGSRAITFTPQAPWAGNYEFAIGSAGSTTLVLQTVLPILCCADAPSTVSISGGTHNSMAPPVEFLTESFLPVLRGCGMAATIACVRHGFHPAGGGQILTAIKPWLRPTPLDLIERGKSLGQHADVLLANLPAHIGMREAQALKHALHWNLHDIDERHVQADGPGNVIIARLGHANVTAVFTAFGELRKAAEQVARDCAQQVRRYAEADAPACEHLADQLLLPLAIGAGGRFRTVALSEHTRTNAAIIARFLGEVVSFAVQDAGDWLVTVRGRTV